jgi:hypothetical protein
LYGMLAGFLRAVRIPLDTTLDVATSADRLA